MVQSQLLSGDVPSNLLQTHCAVHQARGSVRLGNRMDDELADARSCCYDPRSGGPCCPPDPGDGGSSNGRTADSDSACLGSNPSPPAS